jgi:Outer membrane protein beta-barrel domain
MSWTDEELIEMANAAHAEQTFVYQDSFWKEASALLPQKKKRPWSLVLLALVPLAVTIGYIAMPKSEVPQGEYVAKSLDGKIDYISAKIVEGKNSAQQSETSFWETPEYEAQIGADKSLSAQTNPFIGSKPSKHSKDPQRIDKQTNTLSPIAAKSQVDELLSALVIDKFADKKEDEKPAIAVPSDVGVTASEIQGLEPKKFLEIGLLKPIALSIPSMNYQPAYPSVFTRKPRNYWNMYAQAGFGMGQSYVFDQVGNTTSFSLGAGARYNFKGYFLQMGLAGELQNVRLELSERSKIYHTSSTTLENLFSYRQLYRIEMPFTLGYEIKKHVFQANVAPAYLISSKMNYKYLVDGNTLRDETMFGNKTGWNDFSANVGFGYGYKLMKRVTIGADLKWQLMNQLNKDMVNEGNVRPFSGQVFLRKTF